MIIEFPLEINGDIFHLKFSKKDSVTVGNEESTKIFVGLNLFVLIDTIDISNIAGQPVYSICAHIFE